MKKKSNLKIEQEKTDLSKPISMVGAIPWDETNYIYIYIYIYINNPNWKTWKSKQARMSPPN